MKRASTTRVQVDHAPPIHSIRGLRFAPSRQMLTKTHGGGRQLPQGMYEKNTTRCIVFIF